LQTPQGFRFYWKKNQMEKKKARIWKTSIIAGKPDERKGSQGGEDLQKDPREGRPGGVRVLFLPESARVQDHPIWPKSHEHGVAREKKEGKSRKKLQRREKSPAQQERSPIRETLMRAGVPEPGFPGPG
jgi:hypothetical protein